MVTPTVQKIINLIKKSYDQPILFHILHSNLVSVLSTSNPNFEIFDDWSKILVFSAHQNKIPNQGLELKIQELLKRLRPPFDSPEKKLKLMIICYYLLNRPVFLINHILVFELISNFLGYSEHIDGLIIKLLNNIVISEIFNIESNKKIKSSTIERMVELIKSKNLSNQNKIRSLPCFISSDIIPFDLNLTVIDYNFIGYKHMEIFCLYVKYTKNTSYIKDILPNNISFIEGLKDFMNFNFLFDISNEIDIKRVKVEDKSIFDVIKQAYEMADDKDRFISNTIDFISNLR